jgi:hypothetical protein
LGQIFEVVEQFLVSNSTLFLSINNSFSGVISSETPERKSVEIMVSPDSIITENTEIKEVSVYNEQGQVLVTKTFSGEKRIQFKIENATNKGIYFIKINTNKENFGQKFRVE